MSSPPTGSKKRPKINDAAVAELQSRMTKAKSIVGPVRVDPTTMAHLAASNRDIQHLTLTQLEHESVRLDARKIAVQERIAFLVATKTKVRKRCSAHGCTNVAQKGGVCKRHGAPAYKKRCNVDGCERQAQRGGVCHTHGAKYKLCYIEGCTNKVQQGGLCCKHGAKTKVCTISGCNIRVQRVGKCQMHQVEEDDDSVRGGF